ncbi:hypothetical protein cyc_03968 [Cyclospora cayetanensis]|uniref:DEAD/DEAH-box helicase domain-containing protein n=1 Tax=Cyclospora cayetanensis TaxID=88456 RepID=A0A1D3D7Y3_9EIME|nr:hypothetical protein cyc_03968 [Cyclospora cayetanensis]
MPGDVGDWKSLEGAAAVGEASLSVGGMEQDLGTRKHGSEGKKKHPTSSSRNKGEDDSRLKSEGRRLKEAERKRRSSKERSKERSKEAKKSSGESQRVHKSARDEQKEDRNGHSHRKDRDSRSDGDPRQKLDERDRDRERSHQKDGKSEDESRLAEKKRQEKGSPRDLRRHGSRRHSEQEEKRKHRRREQQVSERHRKCSKRASSDHRHGDGKEESERRHASHKRKRSTTPSSSSRERDHGNKESKKLKSGGEGAGERLPESPAPPHASELTASDASVVVEPPAVPLPTTPRGVSPACPISPETAYSVAAPTDVKQAKESPPAVLSTPQETSRHPQQQEPPLEQVAAASSRRSPSPPCGGMRYKSRSNSRGRERRSPSYGAYRGRSISEEKPPADTPEVDPEGEESEDEVFDLSLTGGRFSELLEQEVSCSVVGGDQASIPEPADTLDSCKDGQRALLDARVVENLKKMKCRWLLPIQRYAIPIVGKGHDLLGCAATGCGKTLAFLAPLVSRVLSCEGLFRPHFPGSHAQVSRVPRLLSARVKLRHRRL